MGAHLGLTAANCRAHHMTTPYDEPDTGHNGLDHICCLAKGHENRRKCARCGLEIAQDPQGGAA
jgi:hypothetical protein